MNSQSKSRASSFPLKSFNINQGSLVPHSAAATLGVVMDPGTLCSFAPAEHRCSGIEGYLSRFDLIFCGRREEGHDRYAIELAENRPGD